MPIPKCLGEEPALVNVSISKDGLKCQRVVLSDGLPLNTKRTPFREKESFSRKGLLLSRKRARGIGSGLIHGYYLLL